MRKTILFIVFFFIASMVWVQATDIVINEVDADQTGTDDTEFIELYDGGFGNTALDGLVIVLFNGYDDQSYGFGYELDGYSTDANGYFVIGSFLVPNVDYDLGFATNWIQNGADAVALYTGDAVDFPPDTPITTTNLIDALVYDTNEADDPGLLVLLNAGQPQVNEGGNGNQYTESNQRIPNGSGGLRNTNTYAQAIPTPGEINGEFETIIINEVDADQTGFDDTEFIELYDGGFGNISLNGLVIVLYRGYYCESYMSYDLDGFSTDASGYFVIGSSLVPNVDYDLGYVTSAIRNGADAVALYTGDAVDFPFGTPITTTNLIDALVYDTNDPDDYMLLILLNPDEPQINEGENGASGTESNQRIPNGSGGLRNTNTYAQAIPTPGVVNFVDTLDPPVDLTITVNVNDIDLNWTAVAGATSYNIFRSTDPYSFGAVYANSATNSYTDVGAASGVKYFYMVTATN